MIKIHSPTPKYPTLVTLFPQALEPTKLTLLGTSLEYICPRALPFLLIQPEHKRGLRPLFVQLRHQLYIARVWLRSARAVHLRAPVLAGAKVSGDGLS